MGTIERRTAALGLMGARDDDAAQSTQAERAAERAAAEEAAKGRRDALNRRPFVYVKLHGPVGRNAKIEQPTPFLFPWNWRAWPWPCSIIGWLTLPTVNWLLRWGRQGLKFIAVARSGDVDRETYVERLSICQACPRRLLDARAGHWYCRMCGCPRWTMEVIGLRWYWWPFRTKLIGSHLAYKNGKIGWHCPERRHPGPYPDDGIRAALLESGDVAKEDFDVCLECLDSGGGCGCGGNVNGKAATVTMG